MKSAWHRALIPQRPHSRNCTVLWSLSYYWQWFRVKNLKHPQFGSWKQLTSTRQTNRLISFSATGESEEANIEVGLLGQVQLVHLDLFHLKFCYGFFSGADVVQPQTHRIQSFQLHSRFSGKENQPSTLRKFIWNLLRQFQVVFETMSGRDNKFGAY